MERCYPTKKEDYFASSYRNVPSDFYSIMAGIARHDAIVDVDTAHEAFCSVN